MLLTRRRTAVCISGRLCRRAGREYRKKPLLNVTYMAIKRNENAVRVLMFSRKLLWYDSAGSAAQHADNIIVPAHDKFERAGEWQI